jgi:hypothetical protein
VIFSIQYTWDWDKGQPIKGWTTVSSSDGIMAWKKANLQSACTDWLTDCGMWTHTRYKQQCEYIVQSTVHLWYYVSRFYVTDTDWLTGSVHRDPDWDWLTKL